MSASTLHYEPKLEHARGLGTLTVLAAAFAMAVNAGVFLLGALGGIFRLALAPAGGSMTLGPILLVSALGAAAGMGTFALVRSRARDPLGAFVTLAVIVLLVSFALPFLIPGWSLMQILLLNVMHVTVAGIVIASAWVASRA